MTAPPSLPSGSAPPHCTASLSASAPAARPKRNNRSRHPRQSAAVVRDQMCVFRRQTPDSATSASPLTHFHSSPAIFTSLNLGSSSAKVTGSSRMETDSSVNLTGSSHRRQRILSSLDLSSPPLQSTLIRPPNSVSSSSPLHPNSTGLPKTNLYFAVLASDRHPRYFR